MVRQLLIKVHDLLDRSVKSRQQHSGHDKNTVIAIAALEPFLSERSLKAVNDLFVFAFVGVLLQMLIFIRTTRRYDTGGLEFLQLFNVHMVRIGVSNSAIFTGRRSSIAFLYR